MARFSDIRRGAELKYAFDNWVNYMTDYENRPSNIGQGTPRGEQKDVYLTPFGEDVAADELAKASVTVAHLEVLRPHIAAVTAASLVEPDSDGNLGGKKATDIIGFRPARVVWFRNQNKVSTVATSKVTKLRYLKYEGDRYSCPFGKGTANDDQQDAFKALKARLRAQTFATNRVSLVREKYAG